MTGKGVYWTSGRLPKGSGTYLYRSDDNLWYGPLDGGEMPGRGELLELCARTLVKAEWNLEEIKQALFAAAVSNFRGNISLAARALGVNRRTLYLRGFRARQFRPWARVPVGVEGDGGDDGGEL